MDNLNYEHVRLSGLARGCGWVDTWIPDIFPLKSYKYTKIHELVFMIEEMPKFNDMKISERYQIPNMIAHCYTIPNTQNS